MNAKLKKFVVAGCGIALLLASANHVSAFYNASTGRWLSRDPIGQLGGANLYAFVANAPVDSSDPFGLCQGNGCGGMIGAAIPGFDLKNPLPDVHKNLCSWLEGKIRGYLSTKEDIRGWDRFVGGTANDLELTDSEMASMLGATTAFEAALKKQAQDCKTSPFSWHDRTTQVTGSAGPPWSASIGGVSVTLTTTCACRTLTWEACIFDKYDFDPKWFSTHRTIDGELKVILVWAAQNGAQCGWKEFHHKGCKDGFVAN